MILMIGQYGNLSRALQGHFSSEKLHIVRGEEARNWAKSFGGIETFMKSLDECPRIILYASGIINPSAPIHDLLEINFLVPQKLEEFANRSGIKLVTFGTIMENFDAMSISNPYLFSKKQYYNYLIEKQNKKSNSIHLQIHTWYGLKSLKQFMFLGQMFSAIQNRDFFPMSSGDQLREYHHISDDLNFLTYLLNIDASGVIEINHGETVSLKSLAEYVFSYFDLSDLLKIGSLPEPRQDNFQTEFTPSGELGSHNFRKTLPGVIEYFNLLMAGETEIVPPNIADLDNLSE